MMQRIRKSILVFLVISTITAIPYSNETAKAFIPDQDKNDDKLVVDSKNKMELSKHFRKTSYRLDVHDYEKVNLDGLNTLNISGSHQFSENGLVLIKESIGGNLPVFIVDIKQESHGFINGTAVSWANEKTSEHPSRTAYYFKQQQWRKNNTSKR